MSANTWSPDMGQGGGSFPLVERITHRWAHDTGGGIQLSKYTFGFELPGFVARREYADEMWRLSSNLSLELIAGGSNALVFIGFFLGTNPEDSPSSDHEDPRRIASAFYRVLTVGTTGTRTKTTWSSSTWVAPTVPIGEGQPFSIFWDFGGDRTAASNALWITPVTAHFTLERYRTGPNSILKRAVSVWTAQPD